jgi:hypothetical protein
LHEPEDFAWVAPFFGNAADVHLRRQSRVIAGKFQRPRKSLAQQTRPAAEKDFSASDSKLDKISAEETLLPSNNRASETSPDDQPFSKSDIGRIRITEKRPAPE